MPVVLTDADINDIVRRYRAGETTKQLMAVFKIGQPRLIKILAEHGLSTRPRGSDPKLSPEDSTDLVRRYQAGESTKELGPAYGVSSRVVSDYLRRAGVTARPRHVGIRRWQREVDPSVRTAMNSATMRRRWANASPDEREAMVRPAHDANRGKHRTPETLEAIVAAKQRRGGSDSSYEAQLARMLDMRGVPYRQQVAVGGYCVDFAIGNVAVEVTTGWARKKEWSGRFARLFDEGWHLYVAWHDCTQGLGPALADDLVAWAKILERGPAGGGEHRVIWRSRQILSAGRADADYVASVMRSATSGGYWPLYNRAGDEA